MPLTTRPLTDGWTVEPVAGDVPPEVAAEAPVPATVPGSVHTDLMAAGLVPDPYLDDNERLLSWIGSCDWRYATRFSHRATDGARTDLVFHGLDTVATVELNGAVVARTANMHRTYRVDVTDLLRDGANELGVTFGSAVRHADRVSLEIGARPHVNHHPYNAIRKMACNFGWDWGPDLVTAGIWRPVSLQAWRTARLAAVRPVVDVDSHDDGTVRVHVDVERTGVPGPLTLTALVAGVSAELRITPGESSGVVTVQVDGVRRWWPRGHGDQPLYDLGVVLADGDGTVLDSWDGHVGFRTVALDTSPDEHGTGFTFVVNDRAIFVKGANWIPDDAFPHRVTPERYAHRLAQAEEAGLNLIRVWGGGIYEADEFYAECDRRGLLVWQDFLFACAAYSEEEPLRSEVVAEARDNVTRLMPHPSLALWSGGNENIWGHADWGWESLLDGRSWGMGYYLDVLPAVVAELDPGRPYSAGSPWSLTTAIHPNDPAHGTMHIWDVWNDVDYTVYRDYTPRFASEFGWQGPPTWSTLTGSVSDDPLTPESPGMLVHQKATEGNRKLTGGLVPHLRVPDDMRDWHWAMSLNQARAVQLGIEHFRSSAPVCQGSIVWQLNDCWPVTSWAAVDGHGRRKPLFYALRHAHADRLVTLQPRNGLAAMLVNDTDLTWTGVLSMRRMSYGGSVLASTELQVDVSPRGVSAVPVPAHLAEPVDAAAELVVAELAGVRGLWWFSEDRDSSLPVLDVDDVAASVSRSATGYRVTVTAAALVRDLALLVDTVTPDAVVDDMLVTLLPGETASWEVSGAGEVDPGLFTRSSVLRSANQLVTRPRPG